MHVWHPQSEKRQFPQPKHTHDVHPLHVGDLTHPLYTLRLALSSSSSHVILKKKKQQYQYQYQYQELLENHILVIRQIGTLPIDVYKSIMISATLFDCSKAESPMLIALCAPKKLVPMTNPTRLWTGRPVAQSPIVILQKWGFWQWNFLSINNHPNIVLPFPWGFSSRMLLKCSWC